MGEQRTAVVAATEAGRRLADLLARHLGGVVLDGPPGPAIARAWGDSDRIVAVMATGAAVRLVAGHLTDKRRDPGVVCVDDAGRFAVALTGGHDGGANELAERVAAHLGATPVVTTASEAAGLIGLGELGARFGVTVEPGGDLAAVGGALLSGERVTLVADERWPLGPLPGTVAEKIGDEPPTAPLLWLTDRIVEPPRPAVLYRPPSLVVGVGASRGAPAEEIDALITAALAEGGLAAGAVHTLATVDAKAEEPGIRAVAAARRWPLATLPADVLAATAVPNPSEVVREAVGTPSVAEAAALHLGGTLVVDKRRSRTATVAVARRPARGRLALVSLGPGDPDLLPPLARTELRHAEVVLGYEGYLEQAAAFTGPGARIEGFPLGAEVERARRAVAEARAGRAVALVGSGDVGVYAMASPTLEVAGGDIDVIVVPGITAALAAAALLGAPLGHDHCAISLSDLLTPWERIRERVAAAAAADLAIAFYNPRSRGRDWQLAQARRILLAHRPPDTPVGVVRDAYRPGQRVTITTLADLDVTEVQMTTVVLVGTSRSRVHAGRMVTPRGYDDGDVRGVAG